MSFKKRFVRNLVILFTGVLAMFLIPVGCNAEEISSDGTEVQVSDEIVNENDEYPTINEGDETDTSDAEEAAKEAAAKKAKEKRIKALTNKVNKNTKRINRKIKAIKKHNAKTAKIAKTYKNNSTSKLRNSTLKNIARSRKHYNKSKIYLRKALKLAKQGKAVNTFLKKARSRYRLSYKASRKARRLSKKVKKVYIRTSTRSAFWKGSVITKQGGVNYGPTGIETYYNLPMGGCISMMRNLGYSEKKYPYWVRNDGCKMLGDYIMVGAYLQKYPKGTILECSRGTCIVVDTGYMRNTNHLDIAVAW